MATKRTIFMDSWTTRIKSRMKELKITQEMLANKMGITRGAITHYLAGRRQPPISQFQKLAVILKTDPAWLLYGTPAGRGHSTRVSAAKKEKAALAINALPILSWGQVAEFMDVSKIDKAEIEEFVPHFYTDKSHWYALRVNGEAMTAPQGRSQSFLKGDIIIVDPDKTVAHESYVVALLPHAKEATFKQYVVDGGIKYLKPLNPQYPMVQMEESTHICGVVVNCLGSCGG